MTGLHERVLPVLSRGLLLSALAEAEHARARAEVEVLRLVEQLARTSPAPPGITVDGCEVEVEFGGEGTTRAGEFVVAEVAAQLGMSEAAAFTLISDAVELVQRLPRVWERVEEGFVEPWRGRRIARKSKALSARAASVLDERVAPRADMVGATVLDRLVIQVGLECQEVELVQPEREPRFVAVDVRQGATAARVEAVTDAHTAVLFDAELCRIAHALFREGDGSPWEHRRAQALGVMADPRAHLALVEANEGAFRRPELVLHVNLTAADLAGLTAAPPPLMSGGTPQHSEIDARSGAPAAGRLPGTPDASSPPHAASGPPEGRSHGHSDDSSCPDGTADGDGCPGGLRRVVDTDRFGPVLLDTIREWAQHARITVRPVLDVAAVQAVDSYQVPDRHRDAMTTRHPHCAFPWCTRPARTCQTDHIVPFETTPDGRPARPGQTSVENLAPLCAHHHRIKTHTDWRVTRLTPTVLAWTSPTGHTYLVGPEGTHRADPPDELLRLELAGLRRDLRQEWNLRPPTRVDVRIHPKRWHHTPLKTFLPRPRPAAQQFRSAVPRGAPRADDDPPF